jgi:hypothetical protein
MIAEFEDYCLSMDVRVDDGRARLGPRRAQVLAWHDTEGLRIRAIGRRLGLHNSRVRQLYATVQGSVQRAARLAELAAAAAMPADIRPIVTPLLLERATLKELQGMLIDRAANSSWPWSWVGRAAELRTPPRLDGRPPRQTRRRPGGRRRRG